MEYYAFLKIKFRTYTRDHGQLVYPSVTDPVEVKNIRPVIRVGDAGI